jgi:hypothetical protein
MLRQKERLRDRMPSDPFFYILEEITKVLDRIEEGIRVVDGVFSPGLEEIIYCPQCEFRGKQRLERAEKAAENGRRWLRFGTKVNEAFERVVGMRGGVGEWENLERAVEVMEGEVWRR